MTKRIKITLSYGSFKESLLLIPKILQYTRLTSHILHEADKFKYGLGHYGHVLTAWKRFGLIKKLSQEPTRLAHDYDGDCRKFLMKIIPADKEFLLSHPKTQIFVEFKNEDFKHL